MRGVYWLMYIIKGRADKVAFDHVSTWLEDLRAYADEDVSIIRESSSNMCLPALDCLIHVILVMHITDISFAYISGQADTLQ